MFEALQAAIEAGEGDSVEKLLAEAGAADVIRYHEWEIVYAAVCRGDDGVIKALRQAGVNFDVKNDEGETWLHCSSSDGAVEPVQALIRAGADMNAADSSGMTGLHRAAIVNHLNIINVLIEAGADIEVRGTRGFLTCIDWAAMMGHCNVVQALIQAGASHRR